MGGSNIIITTSRRPSPRTRSLVKDLVAIIPGAIRITRGHLTMEELSLLAVTRGADRILVIGERRGNPSIMRFYRVEAGGYKNIVTIIIRGLALSRELRRPLPEANPSALYIEFTDDSLADFAEALMQGLRAKVVYPGVKLSKNSVKAVLRPRENDEAFLEFFDWRGLPLGPRIRIARASRMIKI
ncbi:MAG: hypothetical protein F7B95_01600 [Desulfurococcales archaeon]|nr:hypothetical protein [Desulfurococcales archaeon]